MKRVLCVILLLFLVAACDTAEENPFTVDPPRDVADADYTVTDSGLKYFDFVVGDGPAVESGMSVSVDYSGWLTDGTLFDSSFRRGVPITFTLGAGRVIDGWEEGLVGMHVGGQRQLVIPPELGYGSTGVPNAGIPPDAVLIFEVDIVRATAPAN